MPIQNAGNGTNCNICGTIFNPEGRCLEHHYKNQDYEVPANANLLSELAKPVNIKVDTKPQPTAKGADNFPRCPICGGSYGDGLEEVCDQGHPRPQ